MDRIVYRCRVCRDLIPIEQECAGCGPRIVGNKIMSIEERKMSRPDSRWKAELRNLYRSAESNRSEATDETERHYQLGVMIACSSIWNRVTGEQLAIGGDGKRTITLSEPKPAQPRTLTAAEIAEIESEKARTCCRKHWEQDAKKQAYVLSGGVGPVLMNPIGMPFLRCIVCGNKRCPKATDCDQFCTDSNEPGQPGSIYG